MDDTRTDRKCFPWFHNHSTGKTSHPSWLFRLLNPLNRKEKIDVVPSVQEDQVSTEGRTLSKEEYERVLQERINSLINDQLRRRDDEIAALKNKVVGVTKELDQLLSNPNLDTILRQTSSSNLSQTRGASCSNCKEHQSYLSTDFDNLMRRLQTKKEGDKNGVVMVEMDITGATPTPYSSAKGP